MEYSVMEAADMNLVLRTKFWATARGVVGVRAIRDIQGTAITGTY